MSFELCRLVDISDRGGGGGICGYRQCSDGGRGGENSRRAFVNGGGGG